MTKPKPYTKEVAKAIVDRNRKFLQRESSIRKDALVVWLRSKQSNA